MAISLDGTVATNQAWSGSSSGTVTLTTSNANDVIVVVVAMEKSDTVLSVVSVASPSLGFIKRGSILGARTTGRTDLELWWAPAASPLSSEVITVTSNANVDDACIAAFGLSGAYNISSPWDTNVLLPSTQDNSNVPATVDVTAATSQDNDFVLYIGANPAPGSFDGVPTGFEITPLFSLLNAGGSLYCRVTCMYRITTAAFGSTVLDAGTPGSNWVMMADAVTADATGGGGGGGGCEYPVGLPCPQTSSVTAGERRLMSERLTQVRAIQLDRTYLEKVSFPPMGAEAAAVFDAWWRDGLTEGGAWFAAHWPLPQGVATAVRRFVGPPQWQFLGRELWRVSATFEVRGRTELSLFGCGGGPAPAPAPFRYWRLDTPITAGALEIQEIGIYNGATRLSQGVTPVFGTTPTYYGTGVNTNTLTDGVYSDGSPRLYWSTITDWSMTFDFGTPVIINGIDEGSFDTINRFSTGFRILYSVDNINWTVNTSVTGLVWPGNFAQSNKVSIPEIIV